MVKVLRLVITPLKVVELVAPTEALHIQECLPDKTFQVLVALAVVQRCIKLLLAQELPVRAT
jgi:hypothetical protein